MVTVVVQFKTIRIGCCGMMRDNAIYEVESGEIDLLKEDCLEVMEDFEEGRDDGYRISFMENDITILDVVHEDDGLWYRYEKGELIAKHEDYRKIFE